MLYTRNTGHLRGLCRIAVPPNAVPSTCRSIVVVRECTYGSQVKRRGRLICDSLLVSGFLFVELNDNISDAREHPQSDVQ